MCVRISFSESEMTAFIKGDIDHHTAKGIRETIDVAIEKINPKVLKLDFGQVAFMDSSGIGLIMGRYRAMCMIKGKLKVVNIPKRLERMIKLSGLVSLGIFERNGI